MTAIHTEQFVQDLFCRPERIHKVLTQLDEDDWQFQTNVVSNELNDVINQEVNFEHGRLDILATFNRRTRLVIIEVKAGVAGIEAVEQLQSYRDLEHIVETKWEGTDDSPTATRIEARFCRTLGADPKATVCQPISLMGSASCCRF